MHAKESETDFLKSYTAKNKIRFLTATALFDGHDASINIFRRLLQARGAEVIHLGHNRQVAEIVNAAIQEDVQGIAISSYQGGHMEFFRYLRESLDAKGAKEIRIFGGGGGVVTFDEILELKQNNIATVYSPEDGQKLGLDGIIGHMLKESDFSKENLLPESKDLKLARLLTLLESGHSLPASQSLKCPVLGVTGTGGAGKSSLLDEILLRLSSDYKEAKVAVLCIDPSKKKTGGALLGDRIRMNALTNENIFVRSIATRDSKNELANMTEQAVSLLQEQNFSLIIVETSGIGQGSSNILQICDISLYVMTPEYGASSQLEKIDMLDYADFIAINKFERGSGLDAIKDVENTFRRSRLQKPILEECAYPIYGTIASSFNDEGVNGLYKAIIEKLMLLGFSEKGEINPLRSYKRYCEKPHVIIGKSRQAYLSQIKEAIESYRKNAQEQMQNVFLRQSLHETKNVLSSSKELLESIDKKDAELKSTINPELLNFLSTWQDTQKAYKKEYLEYEIRKKSVKTNNYFKTLSGLNLNKIALPRLKSHYDIAAYYFFENLPGSFPYTAGIFPFRRKEEDPLRQFAGEGGPVDTNKRFHFLAKDAKAKRLSTAFDSVTLYGSDPTNRPDIFGKIGESGVSIATLKDMQILYEGFDLLEKNTSVSMTINGPAPIILAMFLNTAFFQQKEKFFLEKKRKPNKEEEEAILAYTLENVRGTVQADILKEDQAQNTCIFQASFALKMMGDIQEYFIEKRMRNYYTVSISGYHIAEAGANPITQLAFTLANGFTYVEYYLKRGMHIDDFAGNLSFFFSNGIDAEYSVLGRVARRIWAIAMRQHYGANTRSQKLKYHIQTSGRSLHAQEMDFNDIRTTLQALLALYDNCNSLHTNAYDEALTTPTEQSVRRAVAIQLIINEEFGPNKCENINQGSYFLEELTDLVEEAVLNEFERISNRGGVISAMEGQYQRNKIQEESMLYEKLKHNGDLKIIGINTFINPQAITGEYVRPDAPLIRASYAQKNAQITNLQQFQKENAGKKEKALLELTKAVNQGQNIFAVLMDTVLYASLGEISECLYQLGGKYRRAL